MVGGGGAGGVGGMAGGGAMLSERRLLDGGATAHSQQSSVVSHPLLSLLIQPVELRKLAQLLLPQTSPGWQSLSESQSPSPRARLVQLLSAPSHNGAEVGEGGRSGGDGGGGETSVKPPYAVNREVLGSRSSWTSRVTHSEYDETRQSKFHEIGSRLLMSSADVRS